MKSYRTIAPAKFGPGQVMQLDDKQAALRVGKVEITDGKGTGLVTVKAIEAIEFKAGEVIGLPALERRLEAILEEIKPDKVVEEVKPAAIVDEVKLKPLATHSMSGASQSVQSHGDAKFDHGTLSDRAAPKGDPHGGRRSR